MAGKLVGINTAIFSRSGGSQGIGFAIPANMVRVVVASAKSGGTAVKRPWLGAKLQVRHRGDRRKPRSQAAGGRAGDQRDAGSPAARAGLQTGDVIVAVDGQAVDDPNAFDYRFATKPLGGNSQLGVMRAGTRDRRWRWRWRPRRRSPRDEITIESRSPFLGAKVANLSPALADELRLDASTEGVVVVEVADGSLAQSAGFQRGDIVLSVNNQKIARTRDLERAQQGSRAGSGAITIMRGGQQMSVVFGG